MNISEMHYCARCFSPLADEMTCPFCGHDPNTVYPGHLLEEGTLLQNKRYQVGVLRKETEDTCLYAAWDYDTEEPVLLAEYFPKKLICPAMASMTARESL